MLARESQILAAKERRKRLVQKRGGWDIPNGDPEFRRPDIVLGFRVGRNCVLCGDGFNELNRECHLHPDICNTCEREYCECEVEDNVDLVALEDIVKYPEEKRVGMLLARKMTLKLAGKKASAMTLVQPSSMEHTVYVPFKSRRFYPDPDNEGGHAFDDVERVVEEQE